MSHCKACNGPLSQSRWGYNPEEGRWWFELCNKCTLAACIAEQPDAREFTILVEDADGQS